MAAAITRGDVLLEGARSEHMDAIIAKLRSCGAVVSAEAGGIRVQGAGGAPARSTSSRSRIPGFRRTCVMQAQFMVMACLAKGQSVLKEMIFGEEPVPARA